MVEMHGVVLSRDSQTRGALKLDTAVGLVVEHWAPFPASYQGVSQPYWFRPHPELEINGIWT